ncbi:hypothetical protein ACLKA6_000428 [Drosophila palustris]
MGLRASKRNILSVSSRLFDPLGLLSPLIIKAKILLQELWLQKLDWDESIPLSLDNSWQQLKSTLIQLQRIRIPRYVFTEPTLPIEIHGFADASMRAFGACVYIRSHTAEATFVSNRVAEIQEWTENAEWRHVPTKQNPADIVSRGCDVDELVTSIWFNGPSFQKEPRDSWPVNQHLVTDEMRTLEQTDSEHSAHFRFAALIFVAQLAQLFEFVESQTVHCDNATNFVGASRQFRELRARVEEEADAIQEFASKSGCEFAFIPPRASHFGGLWEAGVKSAKHLLLRTVGSLLLTAEELQTTLVAVEAVLNSRPIGALSDDPSDGEALTPGHALIGGPLTAMPAGGAPDQQGLTCLSRWRAVSSLRRQFWRRWSKEYILGLQARSKWHHRTPDVVVGELVVVAEDNLPPQKWLIGRVTAVHRGEDGAVRVVDLRTATGGAFRRPIHKLARLPIG